MLGIQIIERLKMSSNNHTNYMQRKNSVYTVINRIRPEVNYEINSLWDNLIKDNTGWLLQEIIYYNSKIDKAQEAMRDIC